MTASEKKPINPGTLAPPQGFAHGWLVEAGDARTLYLAGQCAYDREGNLTCAGDLVGQLDRAMENILHVLEAAEMSFEDVVQLNFYVLSRDDYTAARREFSAVWKRRVTRTRPRPSDTRRHRRPDTITSSW